MKQRRRKSRIRHTWFTIWQYETALKTEVDIPAIKVSEK